MCRLLILFVFALTLQADEAMLELMRELPPLAEVQPAVLAEQPDWQELLPGISHDGAGTVRLDARVLIDQGPVDGLEVLACLPGGKTHESLLQLVVESGGTLKTALIALADLPEDGMPSPEASGLPPRGEPVRLRLRWQPEPLLDPERLVEMDLSRLVRNRELDVAYPALPFVYTGSRIERIPVTVPGQAEHRWQQRFMLDLTRSVVVNFNEPDALFASCYPMAAWDHIFEVNTAVPPPVEDQEVALLVDRVSLPLVLQADAQGQLSHEAAVCDDARLSELLQQHYPAELSAVQVLVPPATERDVDLRLRERLLRLASEAERWVVPVFTVAAP